MTAGVRAALQADVERLCAAGDRDLGTQRNRDATTYVAGRLREAGLEVEELEFEVPEWRGHSATISSAGQTLHAHPGPFSRSVSGQGPMVAVGSRADLDLVDGPGAVLLLHGEIARTQLTPRDYPFYGDAEHAAILDALEAARPLAVVAATARSEMTGGMSPFPLIEEVRFAAPTAYLTVEEGLRLAEKTGEVVTVHIDSEVLASHGTQPVGRRGTRGGRVVVSAHVDSKPNTPGAIDNAAGVAVMLAVADLLRATELEHALEFVPFNGEDHVLAPGELAWLAANPDLSDVRLAINVDAPGLRRDAVAYSLYGVSDGIAASLAAAAALSDRIAEGPQWPASDHMIFAMRGVPAVAVTSADFATASGVYSHTPADTPEILDYELLADTARFIAESITAL